MRLLHRCDAADCALFLSRYILLTMMGSPGPNQSQLTTGSRDQISTNHSSPVHEDVDGAHPSLPAALLLGVAQRPGLVLALDQSEGSMRSRDQPPPIPAHLAAGWVAVAHQGGVDTHAGLGADEVLGVGAGEAPGPWTNQRRVDQLPTNHSAPGLAQEARQWWGSSYSGPARRGSRWPRPGYRR